ncbi:(S)-ureidoglycine aminohydrolase [Listeria booriae]|uniref:(S)-ureidoglycine aminohydrolase n=1 Tax=Listeria booriae TaxID=1552123 RepID=UPI001629B13F|nr:(S)-ureidoglycine aminohydrolase [Listeria booriae]MBC2021307.1 (S)-ureidoglycine aminohydrolase [Listeria booriae]
MGYRNKNTGYVNDILASRSVIKRANYAIIPPDGLVSNSIPGFENCELSILATPKLGATFVDYIITLLDGGQNKAGFGGEGIETFFYCLEGKITVWADDAEYTLEAGGYIYCPAGVILKFANSNGGANSEAFLYKKKYEAVAGYETHVVVNNVANLEKIAYEGMEDVILQNLLPADLGFDMNFHILSFEPGACHGYIETHYQEHGAYMLSGEGVYNLDNEWVPVKKGDYLFMGAYVPQATYAVGRGEAFSYLYSKDCNRDPQL